MAGLQRYLRRKQKFANCKNVQTIIRKNYRDSSSGKAEIAFRVSEYAIALNLNPNYLSNVIKAKTGKPIAVWIADKTIAEAKSLLQNFDLSIKEITYKLGFAEEGIYPELRKSLLDNCPMGRLAEVEDVADAAEFFAGNLSSFVNGQHLLVNGGANQYSFNDSARNGRLKWIKMYWLCNIIHLPQM